jgi:hypothetical protein
MVTAYTISFLLLDKPSDLRLEIHKSNTVNESEAAIFQCTIDSNPASNIKWISTRSGKVLQTDHSVLQSSYIIDRAKCTQTGTYMCQATNTVNGVKEMANKTIDFIVLCKLVNYVIGMKCQFGAIQMNGQICK